MSGAARKFDSQPPGQVTIDAETTLRGDRQIIGVSQVMAPEELLRVVTEQGFNHIVQSGGHEFHKEIESSKLMIASPESFLNYPIASVFTPADLSQNAERSVLAVESIFDCSNQKRETLDAIQMQMAARGLPQSITEDVIAVADEMFTNAIFNAPFVDQLTHANPGVSRHNLEIKLAAGKTARIFLAHDESRLMIGCQDPYGSLGVSQYLNKVRATFAHGAAATMNFGPGGAGLGSYIIFNAGASLYLGVWPGRATIVCCVLPLGMSNRKRTQLPKHFHWIQP